MMIMFASYLIFFHFTHLQSHYLCSNALDLLRDIFPVIVNKNIHQNIGHFIHQDIALLEVDEEMAVGSTYFHSQ